MHTGCPVRHEGIHSGGWGWKLPCDESPSLCCSVLRSGWFSDVCMLISTPLKTWRHPLEGPALLLCLASSPASCLCPPGALVFPDPSFFFYLKILNLPASFLPHSWRRYYPARWRELAGSATDCSLTGKRKVMTELCAHEQYFKTHNLDWLPNTKTVSRNSQWTSTSSLGASSSQKCIAPSSGGSINPQRPSGCLRTELDLVPFGCGWRTSMAAHCSFPSLEKHGHQPLSEAPVPAVGLVKNVPPKLSADLQLIFVAGDWSRQ